MTPRTVNVVCARTSVKVGCVPAVRENQRIVYRGSTVLQRDVWYCSACGARVKVVA